MKFWWWDDAVAFANDRARSFGVRGRVQKLDGHWVVTVTGPRRGYYGEVCS